MKKVLIFVIALSLLCYLAIDAKAVRAEDQKESQAQTAVSNPGAVSNDESGFVSGKISKSPMDGKPESFQYVITSDKGEKIVIMGSKDVLDQMLTIPDFEAAKFKLRGKIIKTDDKTGIVANSFEVAIPGMPEGPQLKMMPAASGAGPSDGETTGPVMVSTTPVELPNK